MSLLQLLAFASPSLVTALVHGPIASVLPTLIAKNFDISMTALGTILLVSRLIDGFTDPVVGYLSDRTRSPLGRRKPWIISACPLIMLAVYQLFIPHGNTTAGFYMLWFILLAVAWTILEVPFLAWIAEITGDYHERSRVVTYRSAFSILGGLLFGVAPLLPMFETTEMTLEVLELIGWLIIIIVPIFVTAAVALNPTGKDISVSEGFSLRDLYHSMKSNGPFKLFIVIFMASGTFSGLTSTLGFPIIDSYLKIGDKYPHIVIPAQICYLLALPLWLRIIQKVGKNNALGVSTILYICAFLPFLLIKPGSGAFIPFLMVYILMIFAYGAYLIAPSAMMADIIDYDILKSGANRAGMYNAALTLITKITAAIGTAMAFFLLDFFGYDLSSKAQTPFAILGIKISFVGIPVVLTIIMGYLAWIFPINERRQAIIRRRIEQRALRHSS